MADRYPRAAARASHTALDEKNVRVWECEKDGGFVWIARVPRERRPTTSMRFSQRRCPIRRSGRERPRPLRRRAPTGRQPLLLSRLNRRQKRAPRRTRLCLPLPVRLRNTPWPPPQALCPHRRDPPPQIGVRLRQSRHPLRQASPPGEHRLRRKQRLPQRHCRGFLSQAPRGRPQSGPPRLRRLPKPPSPDRPPRRRRLPLLGRLLGLRHLPALRRSLVRRQSPLSP